jgi:hypothetical protein
VNASLKSVTIPEGDLDLLHQLTAVQELTVTAATEGVCMRMRNALQLDTTVTCTEPEQPVGRHCSIQECLQQR